MLLGKILGPYLEKKSFFFKFNHSLTLWAYRVLTDLNFKKDLHNDVLCTTTYIITLELVCTNNHHVVDDHP